MIQDKAKVSNQDMLAHCGSIIPASVSILVVEQVASYGMAVGKDVFETVFWSGRFCQAWPGEWHRMPRKDVKMHLCGNNAAKDSNIACALIDRFDPMRTYGKMGKGWKSNPGPLYGVSKDIWAALALAITFWDTYIGKCHAQQSKGKAERRRHGA